MTQRLFRRLGWGGGYLLSVIVPRLTAPFGLALDFQICGMVSAMTGYALMYSLMNETPSQARKSRIIAASSLVVGLAALALYQSVLFSPANITPTTFTVWYEFVLFCVAHAAIFGVLAFAYQNGGALILGPLVKRGP